MKPGIICAGLAGTLAIGFLCGRLSSAAGGGDPAGKGEEGREGESLRRSERVQERGLPSMGGKLRQEIRKAPPEKLPAMVAKVMETVDPILRRQLLYDLFERMDAGNFLEVTREMDRASLETGRDNYIEWLLVHARAGQVAGGEAMKNWDPNSGAKISEPVWRTMWGWASTDPDAALQWLNQKEGLSPVDRAKLLNAVASGAIMRDPTRAMELLSGFSGPEKLQCVGQFTFDIVQNGGKDSAIAWLQSVRNSEPDSAYAKRVTESVYDKVMSQSITQTSTATMVADLERFSAVMPVTENLIQRSLQQLRERKPVAGIELLDQVSRSQVMQGQPVSDQLWDSSIRFALARDRNSVADWLAKNSGSGAYQRVYDAYQAPVSPQAGSPPGGR